MTDSTSTIDARRRVSKPERITLNGKVLVRDDVAAKEKGLTSRALGRQDHKGAPFVYIGNVKYRPEHAFNEFFLKRIVTRTEPDRRKPVERPRVRR